MSTEIFIYLATAGWVLTIIFLLLFVWKFELGLNLFIHNVINRNNQVHNLEIENTKENSTSSSHNNETKDETRISESV